MVTENENVVEEKVEAPPAEESVEETPPVDGSAEKPEASEVDLAKEALEVTEEKPEVDPKDAVIGGFRRSLREAELRAARAEGALAAKAAAPLEKSPLELAAEEQGVSVDEVSVDGKLLNKEIEFRQKQTEANAQQQQMQDYQAGSEAAGLAMTDENLGEGLGVTALAKLGEHLLTDQDQEEIFLAGKKCGTVLYKKLKKRIQEAGGAEAQELQKRLKPQKSQSKPKKEQQKKADETESKPPEAEEILDAPSAHIEEVFDM